MIALTRLNRDGIVLNSDLIEVIEATPDTVITLTTGEKLMVLESAQEIVDRVVRFRRTILDPMGWPGGAPHPNATVAEIYGERSHGIR